MSSYKSLAFQIYAFIHEIKIFACKKNAFKRKFGYTEIHKNSYVPTNENAHLISYSQTGSDSKNSHFKERGITPINELFLHNKSS